MDVDTSSYRSDPQPSALDIAGKLGGLKAQSQGIERQGIGIEHDKLNLANQRLQLLSKEYTTLLSDPDVNGGTQAAPSKAQVAGQRMVNLGLIPAPMFGEFAKSIPADPKQVKSFVEQQITRAQSIQEAINWHQGQLGPQIANGQTTQPTRFSPKTGLTAEGQPIQQQVPVTAETIDEAGRQRMQGPTPAVAAPGAVTGPPNRLPVAPIQPDISKRIVGGPGSSVPAPSGPATGQPVLFEENKKAHVADYQQAGDIVQNLRPLQQAYKLIDEFNPRSGPTSETITKWAATAKSLGIIPTATANDPTAIYQEINKKLNQFVAQGGTSGMRSDAAQALSEASAPSLKTQILPALKKLTYDTIALQRGRAILPHLYEGKNYGTKNYNAERFINTNSINEKALMFDYLKTQKEKDALIDEMDKKRDTKEGRDFWKTFNAADEAGLIDTGK